MSLVIQCQNLKKSYTLGKVSVEALRGVHLEVHESEFMAIMGPSGSGKSTLLNMMGAIDKPTSGEVFIDNSSLSTMDRYQLSALRSQKVGFIFQNFNLIPVMSALENVMMPLHLNPTLSNAQKTERALNVLEKVNLKNLENQKPDQLSGGQRQRVAIARALVANPRYILADEPTANLDSTTAHQIIDLLLDLNRNFKTTFIFSTHDDKLISRVNRIVHLRDGHIHP